MRKEFPFLILLPLCFFVGCGKKEQQGVLKIQASSAPHREILEFIKPALEKEGIVLKIIAVDDYNIPNRALAEGEIDANFFQHRPFLEEQTKQFGFALSPLGDVHIEPMGIYGSLDSVRAGGVVAVPSDPTNEGRALLLLEKAGILTLKKGVRYPSVLDIESNPYGCTFKEVDAAFLPRILGDAAAAVIPGNYALLSGLHSALPAGRALFCTEDGSSPYVNAVVVRTGDLGREELLLLKRHLESEETRLYIESTYGGAVVPAVQSSR